MADTVTMTLLFVPCPAGHLLAKVVATPGVGAVVVVKTQQRAAGRRVRVPHAVTLADLLSDTVSIDYTSRWWADDAAPTGCDCGPTQIPGAWLREQLNAGRRKAIWRG